MSRSKKSYYTFLAVAGIPAAILAIFLSGTLFFTLTVDFTPDELPDKIILTNDNGNDNQYLEITGDDEIADIIKIFNELIIIGVGTPWSNSKLNYFRRASGASIYRKIIFVHNAGVTFFYKFDFNRIDRDGKTYWIIGGRLQKLIEMLDNAETIEGIA